MLKRSLIFCLIWLTSEACYAQPIIADKNSANRTDWFYLGRRNNADVFFDRRQGLVFSLNNRGKDSIMARFYPGQEPEAISAHLLVCSIKSKHETGFMIMGSIYRYVKTNRAVSSARISQDERSVIISYSDLGEMSSYSVAEDKLQSIRFSGLIVAAETNRVFYAREVEDIATNITSVFEGNLTTGIEKEIAQLFSSDGLTISPDLQYLFGFKYVVGGPSGGFLPCIRSLRTGEEVLMGAIPAQDYDGPAWSANSEGVMFFDRNDVRSIYLANPFIVSKQEQR